MDLAKTEAMLFKYGSWRGREPVAHPRQQGAAQQGRHRQRPGQLHAGFDAFAGVVKSGGTTRRAAKMVILDADHPDVMDFIESKASEEKKAWALIEQGYDARFTGEAYGSVFFQNANHSVRVTDEFMRAVEADADWKTHNVTDGEPAGTYKAQGRSSARWRRPPGSAATLASSTTPPSTTGTRRANSDRIYAQQPVLRIHVPERHGVQPGLLNLMKFVKDDGEFDVEAYRYACTHHDHGAGDPGRQRQLSDAPDRAELAPASARSAWATRTSARC